MDSAMNETADPASVCEEELPSKELQTLCVADAAINNVPHSLKALSTKLAEHEVTELDVFAGLMYILAVECGYSWDTVTSLHSFDVRRVNAIPTNIPASGNDQIRFIMYLAGYKCTLLMKRFTTKVVVNLSSTSPLLCFSQAYDLSKYVENKKITFSSLPELSKRSKDELFYKMKCYMLHHNDIKFVPSLCGLPPEIILYLIQYLNVGDFLSICRTNQYFFSAYYKDENIWKYFCKKYKYEPINFTPERTFRWSSHFYRETKRNRRKARILSDKHLLA